MSYLFQISDVGDALYSHCFPVYYTIFHHILYDKCRLQTILRPAGSKTKESTCKVLLLPFFIYLMTHSTHFN